MEFTDLSYAEPSTWTWDFGDGSTGSTEQYPVHDFPGSGDYEVCLTVSNENGITTYCAEVTVLFTGVDELEEQEAIFKVFVHVDQSMVQVEIDINFIKNSQLVLYNALGQVVKREVISSSSIQFSTDGLANGTYFFALGTR